MRKEIGLTEKQQEVLEFIVEHRQTKGWAPTVREIGEQFGISSPNGVMCHLRALERKGRIARDEKSARCIRVIEAEFQTIWGGVS